MSVTSGMLEDNSMAVQWTLRDRFDDSLITSGVTVQVWVYEAGTSTLITDTGDNAIFPISLSYDATEEEWQGTVPADADYSGVSSVDVKYEADGGDALTATAWDRGVSVRERRG